MLFCTHQSKTIIRNLCNNTSARKKHTIDIYKRISSQLLHACKVRIFIWEYNYFGCFCEYDADGFDVLNIRNRYDISIAAVASMCGSRRHIHHSSDHTNGRNMGTAHIYALYRPMPVIKCNYFLFTTFIHAKLGISPPTRCLRCATDGSA